jgi:hypothetical protein|tara:strand:+ start:2366 stop:2551 length:186 start_codon:yes stop_codon:yes gene_type:complete
MITLTYEAPSNGDTRVEGNWTDGENSGTFSTKVIYTNNSIDITETESRVKQVIQQINELND